jgi:hypothetical protein
MRLAGCCEPHFSQWPTQLEKLLTVKKRGRAANTMEAFIFLSSFALVLMVTAFWG